MAGSITDVFSQASSGTAPLASTLTAQKAIGANSLSVAASTGWAAATTSIVYFKLYQATTVTTAQGTLLVPINGTETLWKGLLSGLTVNSLTITSGTDQLYPIGSIVEPMFTSSQMDAMFSGLTAEHNQTNGTHNVAAATTIASLLPASSVSAAALGSGISTAKFSNPYKFWAYQSSAQTISSTGTDTKVNLQATVFDTGSNFSTTSSLFTAPAPGFYFFSWSATFPLQTNSIVNTVIYVNGAATNGIAGTSAGQSTGGTQTKPFTGSGLLQLALNDTVGLYINVGNTGALNAFRSQTYLQGYMISAT